MLFLVAVHKRQSIQQRYWGSSMRLSENNVEIDSNGVEAAKYANLQGQCTCFRSPGRKWCRWLRPQMIAACKNHAGCSMAHTRRGVHCLHRYNCTRGASKLVRWAQQIHTSLAVDVWESVISEEVWRTCHHRYQSILDVGDLCKYEATGELHWWRLWSKAKDGYI